MAYVYNIHVDFKKKLLATACPGSGGSLPTVWHSSGRIPPERASGPFSGLCMYAMPTPLVVVKLYHSLQMKIKYN